MILIFGKGSFNYVENVNNCVCVCVVSSTSGGNFFSLCIPRVLQPLPIPSAGALGSVFKRSGSTVQLCLIPNFNGTAVRCSPLLMMLAKGLAYTASSLLRYIVLGLTVTGTVIMKSGWIVSRG